MRRAKRISDRIPDEINQEYEVHFLTMISRLIAEILTEKPDTENSQEEKVKKLTPAGSRTKKKYK